MEHEFDLGPLEAYVSDEDREAVSGVWLDFPGDVSFRVLRAGGTNKAYARVHATVTKPYARQIQRNTLSPEKQREILVEIFVRAVIKDWRGVKSKTGAEIPFSMDAARALFTKLPDLFDELTVLAQDMATFANAQLEEAQETLGNSSAGS